MERSFPLREDPRFRYQGRSYSQLSAARARVMAGHKGKWHVRVGLLDTGFDDRHLASPLYVDESELADADGWVHGWPQNKLWVPGEAENRSPDANPSHGMGTIGLLAGREIILKMPGATGSNVKDGRVKM